MTQTMRVSKQSAAGFPQSLSAPLLLPFRFFEDYKKLGYVWKPEHVLENDKRSEGVELDRSDLMRPL